MATEVRWRRGTATEHDTFTGAEGEVTVDTTDKRSVVHDGVTAGGHPSAKEDEVAKKANNLSDLADASTARTNLGLGSAATHDDSEYEDAGTAQSIMDTHEGASDPHSQYAQLSGGAAADFTSMPLVSNSPIVERGENADGKWIRWADGTQLCWASITIDEAASWHAYGTWTFPATFSESPDPFSGLVSAVSRADQLRNAGIIRFTSMSSTSCQVNFYCQTDTMEPGDIVVVIVSVIGKY